MTDDHAFTLSFADVDAVRAAVGREVCVSEWLRIEQDRIDGFAKATGDFQWIHVDTGRAARESPFGRTIAHGFLTLSLVGKFWVEGLMPAMPFCDLDLNYGLNRLRFTAPVPVGSRVRGRFVLAKADDVAGAGLQLVFGVTVEIEGQSRPALVAEWLVRRHLAAAAA